MRVCYYSFIIYNLNYSLIKLLLEHYLPSIIILKMIIMSLFVHILVYLALFSLQVSPQNYDLLKDFEKKLSCRLIF